MKDIRSEVGWTTQPLKERLQNEAKRLCLNAVSPDINVQKIACKDATTV